MRGSPLLVGADLSGADIRRANLSGASLCGANLRRRFVRCRPERTDLTEITGTAIPLLAVTNWSGVTIEGTPFSRT